MSGIDRITTTLSRAFTTVGTIVTIVEFINLFRIETGIKKELYCKHEDKLTTHVSISWQDIRDLRKKAIEQNLPILETLPQEGDIVGMSLNPLAPRPYVCLDCGNVKWNG